MFENRNGLGRKRKNVSIRSLLLRFLEYVEENMGPRLSGPFESLPVHSNPTGSLSGPYHFSLL